MVKQQRSYSRSRFNIACPKVDSRSVSFTNPLATCCGFTVRDLTAKKQTPFSWGKWTKRGDAKKGRALDL